MPLLLPPKTQPNILQVKNLWEERKEVLNSSSPWDHWRWVWVDGQIQLHIHVRDYPALYEEDKKKQRKKDSKEKERWWKH